MLLHLPELPIMAEENVTSRLANEILRELNAPGLRNEIIAQAIYVIDIHTITWIIR